MSLSKKECEQLHLKKIIKLHKYSRKFESLW